MIIGHILSNISGMMPLKQRETIIEINVNHQFVIKEMTEHWISEVNCNCFDMECLRLI